MKRFFVIAIYFIINPVFSQQTLIEGSVQNEKSKAIIYANVVLSTKDGKIITGSITDEKGSFTMKVNEPINEFLLKVYYLGYKNWETNLEEWSNATDKKITLHPGQANLEEIVITSERPLIENQPDRLIFNVKNSIAAQGMDGIEALRNAPMINIDELGGISIIGKNDVSVMINDRMINLTGIELTNYLSSISSDDISRIEIITTPPAKYEAQGNSGIINIILKNNKISGFSGSINGSFQRNSNNGGRLGGAINYQNGKLRASTKLRYYNNGYSPYGSRDLITQDTKILTEEDRDDRTKGAGVNISVQYELNKKSNVGLIYDYGLSNYTMDSRGRSRYITENSIDSTLTTKSLQDWSTPSHTLNTYYDYKIDTLGKEVRVTGNLLNYRSNRDNYFTTSNTSNEDINVLNRNHMEYQIYSGKVDIHLPYEWATIEFGGKYTYFSNDSDIDYLEATSTENYEVVLVRSNLFNYREDNIASYFSVEKDFNEKWSSKIGLRYEHTYLEGSNPGNGGTKVKKSYAQLFPTAYVSYKPNEENYLSLAYSRRINRPGLRALNPFRWYSNPYGFTEGNPLLSPSFNNNFDFSYTYRNKLTMSIYTDLSENNFNTVARFEDGIYTNKYENSYDTWTSGISLSYYDTFFKIWSFSGSARAYYNQISPIIDEVLELETFSVYYRFNNTISLNEDKNLNLLLNFWHSLPRNYGSAYIESLSSFSPGIRYTGIEDMSISLTASDVFRGLENSGYVPYNGYRENFRQYNDYRMITFSLSYKFGGNKIKKIDKDVDFDDQNRIY